MATLIERLKSLWYDRAILKSLLVAIAVFTIVYFLFPQSLLFNYNYNKGEVWNYETLIASYPVDVLYSDEEFLKLESNIKADLTMEIEQVSPEGYAWESELSLILPEMVAGPDSSNRIKSRLVVIDLIRNFVNQNVIIADSLGYARMYLIRLRSGERLKLERQHLYTEKEAHERLLVKLKQIGGIDNSELAQILQLKFSDFELSENYLNDLDSTLNSLSRIRYTIAEGESIIDKGTKIEQDEMDRLQAYKASRSLNPLHGAALWWIRLGYLMLGVFLFVLMAVYLSQYYPNTLGHYKEIVFFGIWIIAFAYLIYIIDRYQILNVYMIPLVISVLVFRVLYAGHLAFVFFCFLVLICTLVGDLDLQFVMVQLAMGWTAFLSPVLTKSWNKFFTTILYIVSSAIVVFLSFQLMLGPNDYHIQWNSLSWFGLQALLLLLAAPIIPLSERLFGYVSEVKLQELSNLNQSLLKRLSEEASGSFQHSLNVSILSENAALAIDAESLLIKVGALYHDIGKLSNPSYFIENQVLPSPHEEGNELASAKIIISHVDEGVKLAKEEDLPQAIIDFIQTHHGTDRVEFFYQKYQQRTQALFDDDKEFRYAGPLPKTREQGILMLADSIEAASKSIKEINEEKIRALVDDIVEAKIEKGLLSTCVLSLADIEICKAVFIRTLMSMNHVRITYPNQKVS